MMNILASVISMKIAKSVARKCFVLVAENGGCGKESDDCVERDVVGF